MLFLIFTFSFVSYCDSFFFFERCVPVKSIYLSFLPFSIFSRQPSLPSFLSPFCVSLPAPPFLELSFTFSFPLSPLSLFPSFSISLFYFSFSSFSFRALRLPSSDMLLSLSLGSFTSLLFPNFFTLSFSTAFWLHLLLPSSVSIYVFFFSFIFFFHQSLTFPLSLLPFYLIFCFLFPAILLPSFLPSPLPHALLMTWQSLSWSPDLNRPECMALLTSAPRVVMTPHLRY